MTGSPTTEISKPSFTKSHDSQTNLPSNPPDEKTLQSELVINSESEANAEATGSGVDIMKVKVDGVERMTKDKGKANEVEEFVKIEENDLNPSNNLQIQSNYDTENLNSKRVDLEFIDNLEAVEENGDIEESGDMTNDTNSTETSTNSISTTTFTAPSSINTISQNSAKLSPTFTHNTFIYDNDYQDDDIIAEPSGSKSRNIGVSKESIPIEIEVIENDVPYIPTFEEAYGYSPYDYEYDFIEYEDFENRTFRTYGARFKKSKVKGKEKQKVTRNKMEKYFCGIRIKSRFLKWLLFAKHS